MRTKYLPINIFYDKIEALFYITLGIIYLDVLFLGLLMLLELLNLIIR